VVAVANELQPIIKQTQRLIREQDKLLRTVAVTMQAVTSERIFNQGKDMNNAQIGSYSDSYIKQRVKKGLGSNRKVVVTFTGQLQNDWSVVQDGSVVGLGFKNSVNADKAKFVEETYNKIIFEHTIQETKQVNELYGKLVERNFKRN